jgi:hypothetical protein
VPVVELLARLYDTWYRSNEDRRATFTYGTKVPRTAIKWDGSMYASLWVCNTIYVSYIALPYR